MKKVQQKKTTKKKLINKTVAVKQEVGKKVNKLKTKPQTKNETNSKSDNHENENCENFSVHDFLKTHYTSLVEKTDAFSLLFEQTYKSGFVMKEVMGNIGKKTLVKNPKSGKIQEILMLGSNNYLDISNEPFVKERTIKAIEKFGVGCGGPPLLNGYTTLHKQLEEKLAQIKGTEKAILFSSGYSTNLGWISGLLGVNDYLIYDFQNHGSLYDGMKMGNFKALGHAHNKMSGLRKCLETARKESPNATIIVVVEGVYSMDGDLAPLDLIYPLCKEFNAFLAIDDAHGSGVMGATGHGTQDHFGLNGKVDIVMGTFSKTYTVTGGYVATKKSFVDYLRINARSYLFSASLPPCTVAAVLAAIEFIEQNPQRIKKLHQNTQYLVSGLNNLGLNVKSQSAIIPIFVPSEVNMKELVFRAFEDGLFINGIEYPSVPKNRHRLRISMMATLTKDELDFALLKLEKLCREFKIL